MPATPDQSSPSKEVMAREEVVRVCAELWKGEKRRNLMDPNLGDTPWNAIIEVTEGIVEDMVRRMATKPRWRTRELIAFRRVMNTAFRNASEPPAFYGVPLYVSEGVLQGASAELERRQRSNSRSKSKLSRGRLEHALPLGVFASGTRVIRAPRANLPGIRRAFTGPICRVTAEENDLLSAKSHPDPDFPFLRYAKAEVTAYRVMDGIWVDGRTYRWSDHVEHMLGFPSYETGALMLEGGEAHWRRVLDETGFRGEYLEEEDEEHCQQL